MPIINSNVPITSNGDYFFERVQPGGRFILRVSGLFGGGAVTPGFNDGVGNFVAYRDASGAVITSTVATGWRFDIPDSAVMGLRVTGATAADIRIGLTPSNSSMAESANLGKMLVTGQDLGSGVATALAKPVGTVGGLQLYGSASHLNVLDFGAVGNGIADDTAVIQAALNAAAVSLQTRTVLLPPGTFKCNVILPLGVRMFGCGDAPLWGIPGVPDDPAVTILVPANNALPVVWIQNLNDQQLGGFYIKGNGKGISAYGLLGRNPDGDPNSFFGAGGVFKHLTVSGFTSNVEFNACASLTFERVWSSLSGTPAFKFTYKCDTVSMSKCGGGWNEGAIVWADRPKALVIDGGEWGNGPGPVLESVGIGQITWSNNNIESVNVSPVFILDGTNFDMVSSRIDAGPTNVSAFIRQKNTLGSVVINNCYFGGQNIAYVWEGVNGARGPQFLGTSTQITDGELRWSPTSAFATSSRKEAVKIWRRRPEDINKIQDHFVMGSSVSGNIGELGWQIQNYSGATAATYAGPYGGRSGVIALTTGAVAGNGGFLKSNSLSYNFQELHNQSAGLTMEWDFRLLQSTFTRFYIGFHGANGNVSPGDFIGLRADADAGDTTYKLCCRRDGGTPTVFDTAIPITANAWNRLRMSIPIAGTIRMTLNNTATVDITDASVPYAGVSFGASIGTTTAAARTIEIDSFEIEIPKN